MDPNEAFEKAVTQATSPEPKQEAETPKTDSTPAETAQTEPAKAAEPAPLPPSAQAALAALMEKESALRTKEEALKHLEKYRDIESMTPAQKAKALGLSLKDFQKAEIDNFDPTDGLNKKITSLEARIEAMNNAEVEKARAAAEDEARQLVHTYVDSSKDYKVTQSLGLQDAVYHRLLEAQRSGKPISEAKAASEVEAKLREQVKAALATGLFDLPEKATPAASKTISNKTSSETATKTELSDPSALLDQEARIQLFQSLIS